MIIFNYNDLSKQSKIGYNALYNVIFSNSSFFSSKNGENKFTVPLCLNSENKVSLTEKNFIFFESVLQELKLNGYYNIVLNNGRAIEDVKTDFFTVEITISKNAIEVPSDIKNFDFSDVDSSKLLKRNGKEEKANTKENKIKTEEEKKILEEKTEEVEKLKKEVAKKDEQLNKKAIEEFNDDALMTIADCVEYLIKKHCPVPAEFNFASFENDLFKVIEAKWDLEILDK